MKFSIITVCKNAEPHLERSIKSVIDQSHQNFQYIIVDGKSTDLTLNIIEKYSSKIDTVISERDSGIYNAMNKALRYVKGDVVHFLNSDDRFFDNEIFHDIENEFKRDLNAEVIFGNVIIKTNNMEKLIKYDRIDKKYFYKNTICHQALFVKKNLYDLIGRFDENYPIHADVDWLMKAYYKYNAKFHYFDRNICHYSSHGFSSNPIYAEKHKYDRQEISSKYFIEAKVKLSIKRFLIKMGLYS